MVTFKMRCSEFAAEEMEKNLTQQNMSVTKATLTGTYTFYVECTSEGISQDLKTIHEYKAIQTELLRYIRELQ